jgi:peptidoglycan/LPS O-acetylase OafA/YrhL
MTINATTTPKDSRHLTHPKYRADIDGLRAIAVLSVVIFHAFPSALRGGFIGVDIFFVISGFLISGIIFENLERDSFSFVEFYSRRIKRIFPALLLVLISCYAFGWFSLLADEYKQLGKHIAGGAGFIANFMFWQESGYFDNASETKPLLHLWSLGIEEQFYIIWPLLLWVAWKRRFNPLIITLTILVASFVLNISKVRSDTVAMFYSPQTRFWELLLGSVLAYIALYKQNLFARMQDKGNILSVLGLTLIIIGVVVITKHKHFPGWFALLPTLGALLIIAAGMQAWLNRVVLSNRVLVWFGLISFPLYLWHWPLLSFARITKAETPSYTIRIAAVVIAIVLAWLTYQLLEKPVRFGNHSKAKTITLFILMAIMGSVGYGTYKLDGFKFRFPKIVQELSQLNSTSTVVWNPNDIWTAGICFLDYTQSYLEFDTCKPQHEDENNKKPSMLLWGDSTAAALYAGYKASFGKKYTIMTRTASACPPILNMEVKDHPHCKKINDYIFELIKHKKINKVVLEAVWDSNDWKQLERTINQLRQIGITNIDLIGPVPQWKENLPRLLFLQLKANRFQQIPARTTFGLKQDIIQLDALMSDFAKKLNVNYISPIKILCNEQGCITRLGETGNTLIAFDFIHLTTKGSQFLVSEFPKN